MQEESIITQIYGITPTQLEKILLVSVRAELKEASKKITPKQPEEVITRKEASLILKVSVKTISEYSKIGILKPYRFGKFIRFKRSELLQALILIDKKRQ